jgi:fatty acid desaturase
LVGELVSGFFSANVLIGNHEREKRYPDKVEASFIDHQVITCRNYRESNWIWVFLMGGMQFQTEHHLFPQIPFYRLPAAVPIIKEELAKINRSIIYGPVL